MPTKAINTTTKAKKPTFRPKDKKLADAIERVCQRSLESQNASGSPVQAKPVLTKDILKHHLSVGITCPPVTLDATSQAVADYIEDWAVKLLLVADTIREHRYV